MRSSAVAPSAATSTVCPSSASPCRMKLATLRSSSTTRIRRGIPSYAFIFSLQGFGVHAETGGRRARRGGRRGTGML